MIRLIVSMHISQGKLIMLQTMDKEIKFFINECSSVRAVEEHCCWMQPLQAALQAAAAGGRASSHCT